MNGYHLIELVKQRGNPAILETMPSFEPNVAYAGLPSGGNGNARLIQITPASDSAFAFVEVYCWADGAKTASSAFSRQAVRLDAIPAFLAMCEELRFVESIAWMTDDKPGCAEHPELKGYSRWIDEGWVHQIEDRRKKARRKAAG